MSLRKFSRRTFVNRIEFTGQSTKIVLIFTDERALTILPHQSNYR